MRRLKSDLLVALTAAAEGGLGHIDLRWHEETALCVVLAAEGYPGDYRKDTVIGGLDEAGTVNGVTIFHAGTKRAPDGSIRANGGRVLGVTAMAPQVAEAQSLAYQAVDRIRWPEGFCRRDIAWRALSRT
jgi:phosphoribosylamine---glycine ligase